MKKIMSFLGVGLLTMIALASLGHIIWFAIAAALLYWSFRSFLKTPSLLSKLGFGIIGIFSLMLLVHNFPAFVGIGAILLLFFLYRKYKKRDCRENEYHSYNNFDEEWDKMMTK